MAIGPNFLISYLTDASSYQRTLADQRRLGQGAADINRRTEQSMRGLNRQQRQALLASRAAVLGVDAYGNRVHRVTREGIRGMREFGREGVRQALHMERGFDRLGLAVGRVRSRIALLFPAIAGGAAGSAILRSFAEFDDQIALLQFNARQLDSIMPSVEARIREVARVSRFMGREVAGAATQFVKGGFAIQDALEGIESTLQFATVGQVGLNESIAFATEIIKAYRFDVAELERVWDVLLVTQQNSLAQVNELRGAFAKVGSLFKRVNVDIEESAAIFGVLADANIRGENAGTQLRIVMSRLIRPVGDAADALARYGIAVDDVSLESNRLIPVLRTLADANISLSDQQAIFNQRAFNTSNVLFDNIERLEELVQVNKNANGTLKEGVRIFSRTLPAALKRTASAFEDLGISIGRAINARLIATLDNLSASLLYLSDNVQVLGAPFALFGIPLLGTIAGSIIGGLVASRAWRIGFLNPLQEFGKTVGSLARLLVSFPAAMVQALVGLVVGGMALPTTFLTHRRMRRQFGRNQRDWDQTNRQLADLDGREQSLEQRVLGVNDPAAPGADAKAQRESLLRRRNLLNDEFDIFSRHLRRSGRAFGTAMAGIAASFWLLRTTITNFITSGWSYLVAAAKSLAFFFVKLVKFSPVILGVLYFFRDIMRRSVIPGVSYLGRTLEAVGRAFKYDFLPWFEDFLRRWLQIDFVTIASGLSTAVATVIFALARLVDGIGGAVSAIYATIKAFLSPDHNQIRINRQFNTQAAQRTQGYEDQLLADKAVGDQIIADRNERALLRINHQFLKDYPPAPTASQFIKEVYQQDLKDVAAKIVEMDQKITDGYAKLLTVDQRTELWNKWQESKKYRKLPDSVTDFAFDAGAKAMLQYGSPAYDAVRRRYYEVTQEDHLKDRLGEGFLLSIPKDTDNKKVFGAASGTETAPGPAEDEPTVWRDFNQELIDARIELLNLTHVAEKKLRIQQLETDLIEEGTVYSGRQLQLAEQQLERLHRQQRLHELINEEMQTTSRELGTTLRKHLLDEKPSWSDLGERLAEAFIDSWADRVVEGVDRVSEYISNELFKLFESEQSSSFGAGSLIGAFLGIDGDAAGATNTNLPNTPPPGTPGISVPNRSPVQVPRSAPAIVINNQPTINNQTGSPQELAQILRQNNMDLEKRIYSGVQNQQRTNRRA